MNGIGETFGPAPALPPHEPGGETLRQGGVAGISQPAGGDGRGRRQAAVHYHHPGFPIAMKSYGGRRVGISGRRSGINRFQLGTIPADYQIIDGGPWPVNAEPKRSGRVKAGSGRKARRTARGTVSINTGTTAAASR